MLTAGRGCGGDEVHTVEVVTLVPREREQTTVPQSREMAVEVKTWPLFEKKCNSRSPMCQCLRLRKRPRRW